MPHYNAPTKDMQYVLNDVLDVKNSSIPGYADLDADSLSDHILLQFNIQI